MQNVKTAISIQKSLFEQADKLARKMQVSRSRLYTLALEDYMRREQNRELLTKINAAFADEPDAAETTLRRKGHGTHRRLVNGKW